MILRSLAPNLRQNTSSRLNLSHLSNIIGNIKHSLHHQTFTTNFSSSSLTHFSQDISQTNSLIASHVRRGDPVSAWILFHSLRRARAVVDAYTFTSVLRACTILHVSQLGIQVHAQMLKTGADSGTVAKTSLVDMYSKCGSLDEAVKVFDEMGQRDVVAWNALLSCFLRCDLPVEAVGVLRAMGRENVELSEFTLCSALKCCASLKAMELGRQVHGLVVCMGRDMVVLSTALIDFYSSVGCVDDALKVFCSLKGSKDDMIYNSLVSGCVRNRRYGEAFRVMGSVRPNAVALTSALVACSENLDLWAGKQMHCVAVRQGFTRETQMCNALLDMYGKCGKVLHAQSLFDGICEKDVISWTCMIDAYGRNGRGLEAVLLFQEMRKEGRKVLPNSVTFLSVLSACGHSGLVEEGKKCFKLLREKYGLEPDPEHYACYIDILGRAGNIEGVWSVYHNMVEQGTRLTEGIWVALLNACSLNQDVERGELAAKHLLQLEPNKSSYIVLVSNFYAAIGRWDRVDELRSIMRTKGLLKEAGNSWINVLGFNQHARCYWIPKLLRRFFLKFPSLGRQVILSPVDYVADTYRALLPEGTPMEFQRIRELKGLKKADQQSILDDFNKLGPGIKQTQVAPTIVPAAPPAAPVVPSPSAVELIASREDVLTRAAALGRGAATTGFKRFLALTEAAKDRKDGPAFQEAL